MTTTKNRKKGKSSARPRSYSELYKSSEAQSVPAGAVKAETAGGSRATASRASAGADSAKKADAVDWKGEYGYVFSDLRKLFIVSAVLFIAIIGIGLLI